MFLLRSSVLLSAFFHVTHVSVATYLDLYHRSSSLPNLLARTANGTSGLDLVGTGYNVNITLGNKTFSVMIDTGRWAPHPNTFFHSPCSSCLPAALIKLSSDLWVAGTVPGATDTGTSAGVHYVAGSAQGMHILHHARSPNHQYCARSPLGPVKTAELDLLGFTVPNQAFSTFRDLLGSYIDRLTTFVT